MVPADEDPRIVKQSLMKKQKSFPGISNHGLRYKKKKSNGDGDLRHVIKKNMTSKTLCFDCDGKEHLRGEILCRSSYFISKQNRESSNDVRNKSGNWDDDPLFLRHGYRKRLEKQA